jgi:hypothetical protein
VLTSLVISAPEVNIANKSPSVKIFQVGGSLKKKSHFTFKITSHDIIMTDGTAI